MGYGAFMAKIWRGVEWAFAWAVVVGFVVLMVWAHTSPDAVTGETIPQSTNYAGS
jgi:hypothetical protein